MPFEEACRVYGALRSITFDQRRCRRRAGNRDFRPVCLPLFPFLEHRLPVMTVKRIRIKDRFVGDGGATHRYARAAQASGRQRLYLPFSLPQASLIVHIPV
jgi:hypothetical protein